MMDELDFLKKDWKKQEETYPKLSYDEIYKMLWKRSSSIVRWIFVISICELFLSTFLSIFLADEAYWEQMENLGLKDFTIGYYIFSYAVTFYFIYLFYRNYKKISNTDNTATLMKNILKTRKTVKTYIAYVLISAGFSGLVVSIFNIKNHQLTSQVEEIAKYSYDLMDWIKFILISFVAMAIVLGFVWLFYRLIYGILLKKLKKNYTELKKLEM
ncbi:MAG TPA: hypothetical protein VFI78_04890 [Salinimicrobium sp.]|nr:hypothetical protein [Salinimicrobium sp.]